MCALDLALGTCKALATSKSTTKFLFHNFRKLQVTLHSNIVALNLKPHNHSSYNIGHNGQHHPFGTLYITSFEKKCGTCMRRQAGGQSMKNEKIRYRDLYSASIPYPTHHAPRTVRISELKS